MNCEQVANYQVPAATFSGGCGNTGSVNGSVTASNVDCNGGSLTITYSGIDNCGNAISTTCTATVSGTGPASIACPTLPAVSCDQATSYVVPAATFSGACNNSGTINGTISANNFSCSGGSLTITYSGSDQCGNLISTTCTATVTAGPPATISCPVVGPISCSEASRFQIPAASFSGACNNNGSLSGSVATSNFDCAGGSLTLNYSGTDNCGNSISTTCSITVSAATPATVACPNLPQVNCEQVSNYVVPAATYSGGCNNTGSINGSVTATNVDCNGGSLTITYSGNDQCGNALNTTCTVQVTGSGAATLVCPTVAPISCTQAATYVPQPASFSGACNNTGSLLGTITANNVSCGGGNITVLYSGTDVCGNQISTSCNVSVAPAGPAQLACPTVTTAITCEEAATWIPPVLTYSGDCNNSGQLSGLITDSNVLCTGGSLTVLYSGVDQCGNSVSQNCNFQVAACMQPQDVITNAATCPGVPFIWPVDGQAYSNAGTFTVQQTDANGCVFNQVLNLTVFPTTPDVTQVEEICQGQTFTWTVNGQSYTTGGTFTAVGTDANGCAFNNVLQLTVTPSNPGTTTNEFICSGSSFTWPVNGVTYTTAGTFIEPGIGCDGDQTLVLAFYPATPDVTTTQTICEGEVFVWPVDGQSYSTAGTFNSGGLDANGCTFNNVLVLNVTPRPQDVVTNQTICPGSTFTWPVNGVVYSSTGTIVIDGVGCTATQILNLTVLPQTADVTTTQTICQGEVFTWPVNGQSYSTSGTFTAPGTDANGCPFNNVLVLTVTQPGPDVITNQTICSGTSFTWPVTGETFTIPGTYRSEGVNCASDQVLNLSFFPISPDVVTNEEICQGDSFTWTVNGQTYTTGGTFSVPQSDANGCTFNQILNLVVLTASPDVVTNQTICAGSTFFWPANGVTYDMAGTFRIEGFGCDGDQVLNLSMHQSTPDAMTQASICQGETFVWPVNGVSYTTGGTFVEQGTDANGCTFNQILILTVTTPGQDVVTDVSICEGESFLWTVTGIEYTTPGTFTSMGSGCAGDFVLNLSVYPRTPDQVENETICAGDDFFWTVTGDILDESGTFTATRLDDNGCEMNIVLNLTVSTPLVCTTVSSPTSCGAMGTATVTTVGGSGGYTYNWSNGSNTSVATGLNAGTFTVTVSDTNGCTTVCSVDVEGTDVPECTTTSSPTSCGAMGSATVTAVGGAGGYTYIWTNGATTAMASGLPAGEYFVTVTDLLSCSVVCSATVEAGDVPTCTIVSTDARCGEANGSATVTAIGGSGGYTYAWNNSANTPANLGLTPGLYSVVVTDSNGCSTTCSIEVGGNPAPTCTTTSTPSGCSNASGTATVLPEGGLAPYSYEWSNGNNNQTAISLVSGTYLVTVTDAMGCSTVCNAVVESEGDAPECTIAVSDSSCGESNGSAVVTATGGSGQYTYRWSNDETTAQISDLIGGVYSVTVTDTNGCETVCTGMINSIGGPSCSVTVADASCGTNNGYIIASATGGTGIYSYLWSTGATTPEINDLSPGTYTVTVSDSKGCSVVCTGVVMTSGSSCGEIGNRVWHDVNGDGVQGNTEIGIGGVTVNLFNATTGAFVTSVVTNAQGEYLFSGLPEGDYFVNFDNIPAEFISTEALGTGLNDSDVTGANGINSTDIITITAGDRRMDIDAGFYRGGEIGNIVWCDNEENNTGFNVYEASDTLVQGAVVKLFEVVGVGNFELVACDTTDTVGEFLFTGLPRANYVLEVTISDDKFFVPSNSGSDDSEDSDVEIEISVDPVAGTRTGRTGLIFLAAGETNLTVDAGSTTRRTLQIELLDFDGYWVEDRSYTDLFWSTSREVNSDYIEVQRSRSIASGFAGIGTRKAQGRSEQETNYKYFDTTITEEGIYYYRLKLVDIDGSFTYSRPISIDVDFGEGAQEINIDVYPNPVREIVNVDIEVERPSALEGGIYDAIGQLIREMDSAIIPGGTSTIQVDLEGVPAGAYLIRIQVDEQVYFEKVSIID